MNTSTSIHTSTDNSARNSTAAPAATRNSRLSALALASVMTLAMLLGVNGLATSDVAPAQMAQKATSTQA